MKKYTWHYYNTINVWDNEIYDTIEECLQAARRKNAYYKKFELYKKVYIGECTMFTPYISVSNIFDQLEEDAAEFAGEVGGDWNSHDRREHRQVDDLEVALNAVLHTWLKEHGYYPEFYQVDNVVEYDLGNSSEP